MKPTRKYFVAARAGAALLLACLTASACANPNTATTVTAAISGLVLSTTTVVGGATVTGIITLTTAAPVGGASVTLSSSNAVATVPASVVVPAGSTTQSFGITTTSTTASSTITATYLTVNQSATLTVTVVTVPTLQSLYLSTNVSASSLPIQGTITLTSPAPAGGLPVSVVSNSALASVPAIVRVPQGATSQVFQIATASSNLQATVAITASYSGVTQTATFTIGQLAVSLLLRSVPGGLAVTGTITLPMPAPSGGAVIVMASNTPDAVVPPIVVVPAGATVQTFTIATVNAPPTTTATISATYAGVTQTAALIVVSYPTIANVTCTPASPSGGATIQCSGTLTSAGPASGWRLSIASSDPSIVPPPGITVPASSQTFQFALATTTVTTATTVSVQIVDALSNLPLWGQIFTVSP